MELFTEKLKQKTFDKMGLCRVDKFRERFGKKSLFQSIANILVLTSNSCQFPLKAAKDNQNSNFTQ